MHHRDINPVKTELCQVLISMHHFLRGPPDGSVAATQEQLTGTGGGREKGAGANTSFYQSWINHSKRGDFSQDC